MSAHDPQVGAEARASAADAVARVAEGATGGPPDKLLWASKLNTLLQHLNAAPDDATRNEICGSIWQILNAALGRYARFHASRLGRLAPEDLEDIAAGKAFDLLRRAGRGGWDVSGRTPAETAAFLSSVARNGVADRLSDARRQTPVEGEPRAGRSGQDSTSTSPESPDLPLLRKEFALALRRCAERLNPRVRLAWFFRVFYSMSSKTIAKHPDIGLKASHVDVLLHRARRLIQDCMREQGYGSGDMPPGSFVELWRVFRTQGG